MDFDGAIANLQDLNRLHELECAGYFKPGFAFEASQATMRYFNRIISLKVLGELRPYPGPVVSE